VSRNLYRNPQLWLRGLRDPSAALVELNRLYHRRRSGPIYNRGGVDVFEEDWDNLIILDACRFDYYAETSELDGPLDSRTSRGSASDEFVRGNFRNRELHDVVYVTGNRWLLQLYDDIGCELHGYRDIERDITVDRASDVDDDVGYVPHPETALETAIEAAEEFPRQRLVVHLMQPHKPYLGPERTQFRYDGGLRSTMAASPADDETLRKAYRDTLEITLDALESRLDAFDGRTVITADHGELLGERLAPIPVQWYGHPGGIYVPELVEVPWHVVTAGPRRHTTADPPVGMADVDDEDVTESLRALGYVQ